MRVTSEVITMDVEIDRAEVRDGSVILSGFAGLAEVETRISPREAWSLARLICRGSILWVVLRAAFRS